MGDFLERSVLSHWPQGVNKASMADVPGRGTADAQRAVQSGRMSAVKRKRTFAIVVSLILTITMLWTVVPAEVASGFILLSFVIVAAFLTVRWPEIRRKGWVREVREVGVWIWGRPVVLTIALTAVLLSAILIVYAVDEMKIAKQVTAPEDSLPWHLDLPARVYWNELPSYDAQQGFAKTARLLGFRYEEASTRERANIRVWPNSWKHKCKWLETAAFVSLDPSPPAEGVRTADLYICRFTLPWHKRIEADLSLVAHEAAHIFAAKGHFGAGLMAEGGGDGSSWFSDEDIKELCKKITGFHAAAEPGGGEGNRRQQR